MRRAQNQKGFFEEGPRTAHLPGVDELRRSAQRALRELQPAGHEIAVRPAESREKRPEVALLTAVTKPLSASERLSVANGRARCSALNVPYRVTPRLPVRPVGAGEIPLLVDLSERVAVSVPPALLRLGLHPRLLASIPSLALTSFYALLIGLKPSSSGYGTPVILSILWWCLMLPSILIGVLHVRFWSRRHAPPQRAASESWVPWLIEELTRGTAEAELREYLVRALPHADLAAAGDMLAHAKARM